MPRYSVTVRHGPTGARYHTLEVEAPDMGGALRATADRLPDDVRTSADLVELRTAPDPDARPGLGGEAP